MNDEHTPDTAAVRRMVRIGYFDTYGATRENARKADECFDRWLTRLLTDTRADLIHADAGGYHTPGVVLHLDHPGFRRDFKGVAIDGDVWRPVRAQGENLWRRRSPSGDDMPTWLAGTLAGTLNALGRACPVPRPDAPADAIALAHDIHEGRVGVLWKA